MSGKHSIEKNRKTRTGKRVRSASEKSVRVPDYYFYDSYYTGGYTRSVISERLASAPVLE
jgi:hypothetical protein